MNHNKIFNGILVVGSILTVLMITFIIMLIVKTKMPLIDKPNTEPVYCTTIAGEQYCTDDYDDGFTEYIVCDIDNKDGHWVVKLDTMFMYPEVRVKFTSIMSDLLTVERFNPESKTKYAGDYLCIPLYNYILNVGEIKQ